MKRNYSAERMTVQQMDWSYVVLPGSTPDRGAGWFGVWEFHSGELTPAIREVLVAAGYTQVDNRTYPQLRIDEQWALLTPALPVLAMYLITERVASWANWKALYGLWCIGFVEAPHPAEMVTWRNSFSPYPWRGTKRRRTSVGSHAT